MFEIYCHKKFIMVSEINVVGEAIPYTNGDLFREASEGRSLHDDCSKFYRQVMGLVTPLKDSTQPTVDEIGTAIEKNVARDDLSMWTIVYSLFQTERSALWPDNGRQSTREAIQSSLLIIHFKTMQR